VMIVLVKN